MKRAKLVSNLCMSKSIRVRLHLHRFLRRFRENCLLIIGSHETGKVYTITTYSRKHYFSRINSLWTSPCRIRTYVRTLCEGMKNFLANSWYPISRSGILRTRNLPHHAIKKKGSKKIVYGKLFSYLHRKSCKLGLEVGSSYPEKAKNSLIFHHLCVIWNFTLHGNDMKHSLFWQKYKNKILLHFKTFAKDYHYYYSTVCTVVHYPSF